MLVLSRRLGERILMPGLDVAITVLAVKGNKVRIGVEAPSDQRILRAELQFASGRAREFRPRVHAH